MGPRLKRKEREEEEEEEWEDASSNEEPCEHNHPKDDSLGKKSKKKKKKKVEVKPPTAEEMMRLNETEALFKSNLFRLQTEEMVKELKPKSPTVKGVRLWIEGLKKHLDDIQITPQMNVSDGAWLKANNVRLPFDPPIDTKAKAHFEFVKPVQVFAMGAYRSGTLMGNHLNIDVGVVMPKECFVKGDHLNMRYHSKRSCYLAVLAACLKESPLVSQQVEYSLSFGGGDPLKPVLVVAPSAPIQGVSKFVVHLVPEDGAPFKPSQLSPLRNNLRQTAQQQGAVPTPFYNASILDDLFLFKNETMCEELIKGKENVTEAIILLKVWLKQRGLSEGCGSFNNFLMTMYLIHLLKTQRIKAPMSSYQIIRFFWLHLSQSDWETRGISLGDSSPPSSDVREEYAAFDVLFLDASKSFNMACRLNKFVFRQVVNEAALAIKYLDSPCLNSFTPLFMIEMPFIRQFDNVLCFTELSEVERVVKGRCSPVDLSVRGVFPLFSNLMGELFERGVKSRVRRLSVACPPPLVWAVSSECPSHQRPFMFGFELNPQTAFALVERGPPPDSPEAQEFRDLWEGKCETRRFRDGAICEAVVWGKENVSLQQRRSIVFKMVEFLLNKYLQLPFKTYNYISDNLASLITNQSGDMKTMEEACQKVHRVYQDLSQDLRKLSDLPLSIVSVRCISPVYRFTDVAPPQPIFASKPFKGNRVVAALDASSLSAIPPHVTPIDVVIRLSISSKWPEDVKTGRRLVAAFNIAIGNSLKSSRHLETLITPEYILVLKDGYVFRIFLGYEKEVALIKKQVSEKGVVCYRDSPESISLEKRFISLPKLTGALFGVSQTHSAFGPAACLAKRWLSSHLIDDAHFPYVVVDLLVARLFLSPEPYAVPNLPLVAFMRFLSLLASTNWQTEAIIVNFNNLLSREEVACFEKHFSGNRGLLPSMVVATPYDPSGTLWTRQVPTLQTLVRLAKLASASLRMLDVYLTTLPKRENLLRIFQAPMGVYDVVIRLLPSSGAVAGKRRPQAQVPSNRLPLVDFNPPNLYIRELRANYSDVALFFYNPFNSEEIGVVLKPGAFDTVDFKVTSACGREASVVGGSLALTASLDCFIEDFKALGEGLVDVITLKQK